jgi:hypothetical protein
MAEETRVAEPMPLGAKLWVAGLLVMLLAVGTSVASVMVNWSFEMPRTVAIGTIEGVERLGGIEIPSGARLIGARMTHSVVDLDPIGWAILEMPRDDARMMLRTPPLVEPDYDGRPVSDDWRPWDDELADEWRPDQAEKWIGAVVGKSRREFWHVNALADFDREPARVYLLLER